MFDYEFFAWWGGLNPALRFGLTLAVLLAGGLVLALGGAWLWWLPLLVIVPAVVGLVMQYQSGGLKKADGGGSKPKAPAGATPAKA